MILSIYKNFKFKLKLNKYFNLINIQINKTYIYNLKIIIDGEYM